MKTFRQDLETKLDNNASKKVQLKAIIDRIAFLVKDKKFKPENEYHLKALQQAQTILKEERLVLKIEIENLFAIIEALSQ